MKSDSPPQSTTCVCVWGGVGVPSGRPSGRHAPSQKRRGCSWSSTRNLPCGASPAAQPARRARQQVACLILPALQMLHWFAPIPVTTTTWYWMMLWKVWHPSFHPSGDTMCNQPCGAPGPHTWVSTWCVRLRLAVVDSATATASASLRMAALLTRPSAVPSSCRRSSAAALVACTCSAWHNLY